MIIYGVAESNLVPGKIYRLFNRFKFHGYEYKNGIRTHTLISSVDQSDEIVGTIYEPDSTAWDYFSEDNVFKFGR